MTLKNAANYAAVGVLLRGLHYCVANLLPSWEASGIAHKLLLLDLAVVNPMVWIAYFASVARGEIRHWTTMAACALGLIELAYALSQQYRTLSLQSIESITFVLGIVIPVLCWTLYLLGRHTGLWALVLWYLLLVSAFQTAYAVYQVVSSASVIRSFWQEDPWRLVAAPLIWIVFWATQTLFVRTAQKA